MDISVTTLNKRAGHVRFFPSIVTERDKSKRLGTRRRAPSSYERSLLA